MRLHLQNFESQNALSLVKPKRPAALCGAECQACQGGPHESIHCNFGDHKSTVYR